MEQCVKGADGSIGFKTTGGVVLSCDQFSCGPYGKAEFWCEKCCELVTTAYSKLSTSLKRTSTAAPSSTIGVATNSGSYSSGGNVGMQPQVIFGISLGCLLIIILCVLIAVLANRRRKHRRNANRGKQTLDTNGERTECIVSLDGQVALYGKETIRPVQPTPDDALIDGC